MLSVSSHYPRFLQEHSAKNVFTFSPQQAGNKESDVLSKCTWTVVCTLSLLFGTKSIILELGHFVLLSNVAFVEIPKGLVE